MMSRDDAVLGLVPVEWMTVFHTRKAERDITEQLGREFPNQDVVVDLVHSAVEWYDFVQRVMAGFDAYLEWYTDALNGRELLGMILERLPSDLAAHNRIVIDEIDGAFRAHTSLVQRMVWEPSSSSIDDDLYRRIPIDLREPLLSDLRTQGVVA